jgi:hypothetical protein
VARYSKAVVLRNAQIGFYATAIGLRTLGGAGASVAFIAIAISSLFGRGQIIHSMLLCWYFTYMTPAFSEPSSLASVLRYLVFACAALSITGRHYDTLITMRVSSATLSCVALGLFFICHSLLFSEVPDVSVLKAAAFITVAATLMATWGSMSAEERQRLEYEMFGGLLVMLAASVPLLFSELGFLKNGRGFQGLLSHPQSFGPVTAFVAAWLIGRILKEARTPPYWMLISLSMCLLLGALSQARIAALALLLSVSGALLVYRAQNPLGAVFPALRSGRIQLLIFAALASVLMAGPIVYERLIGFAVKEEKNSGMSATEAMDSSRGELVRNMTDNIERKFWTGIGFGVASRTDLITVERDPGYGMPVSAAVEKGVMPIAILEELGPIGFVCVAYWLLLLGRRSSRSIEGLTVFLACLASNLGEATFFATGGMGLLTFNFCAWAATQPERSIASVRMTTPHRHVLKPASSSLTTATNT